MSLFTFCLKVGTITHVVCGTYPDVLSLFFSEVSDDESCHCLSLRFLPGLQIHCTVLYVILSTWFSVKLAGHCVEVWVAIKVLWAVMIGRCEPPSHLSSPPRSGALPVLLKASADEYHHLYHRVIFSTKTFQRSGNEHVHDNSLSLPKSWSWFWSSPVFLDICNL